MSTTVRTPECFPSASPLMKAFADAFGGPLPELQPNHDACPRGHHLPGVIGGWHCPCPCHQSDMREATG